MNVYLQSVRAATLTRRLGVVQEVTGHAIHARGPEAVVGELCAVETGATLAPLLAEVVSVRPGATVLMPYGSVNGLGQGAQVRALGDAAAVPAAHALLGRVVNGWGEPLDGRPLHAPRSQRGLRSLAPMPMQRPRIDKVLDTGVRAIDALLPIGFGQRVGIFSGSGVGKSTLLGMIARRAPVDVNIIALIGERGREVREFVDNVLGPEGLARSIVVAATSDEPAVLRVRATLLAIALAEQFRDQGQQVLFTLDSVTRYAMARREIGLAAGEPPTARGYTPSVFSDIPQLCERCGTQAGGGSITALMTVLVEGDDMNDPVADTMRATLDGHIVLSRTIAHSGRYPAIDLLHSTSRLGPQITNAQERELAASAINCLALLERNRSLVEIGAYQPGVNAKLDAAVGVQSPLEQFLRQAAGTHEKRLNSLQQLHAVLTPWRQVHAQAI